PVRQSLSTNQDCLNVVDAAEQEVLRAKEESPEWFSYRLAIDDLELREHFMPPAIELIDRDQTNLLARDTLPGRPFAFPHLLHGLTGRLPNLQLAGAMFDEVGDNRNDRVPEAIENLLEGLVLPIHSEHLRRALGIALCGLECAEAVSKTD